MLETIRQLREHLVWADTRLLDALEAAAPPPDEALREYAHVLGAGETWLSRLEGRAATLTVWPEIELPLMRLVAAELHAGYTRYLADLDASGLEREVAYTTSDGRAFSTRVHDILLQVALHAQYHRGKINLLMRQAGQSPVQADYISYVRGVEAVGRG
jgi:uncharacterized damage-inducible protein DinB